MKKEELEERLNIKRHGYLKILSQQLKNEINNGSIVKKEALERANKIVHYSRDKIDKDGLIGLLPSFLGTTYTKYWDSVRKDLIKKIDKKFN